MSTPFQHPQEQLSTSQLSESSHVAADENTDAADPQPSSMMENHVPLSETRHEEEQRESLPAPHTKSVRNLREKYAKLKKKIFMRPFKWARKITRRDKSGDEDFEAGKCKINMTDLGTLEVEPKGVSSSPAEPKMSVASSRGRPLSREVHPPCHAKILFNLEGLQLFSCNLQKLDTASGSVSLWTKKGAQKCYLPL